MLICNKTLSIVRINSLYNYNQLFLFFKLYFQHIWSIKIANHLKVWGLLAKVVILEWLLGPRICEPAPAQIVELGDQASELTVLYKNWAQLVLVVLREGTENKTHGLYEKILLKINCSHTRHGNFLNKDVW